MCFAATPKSTRPEANGKKINDYFKVGKRERKKRSSVRT